MRLFPKLRFVKDRESHLVDLCRDKVVLHLGCADALFLKEKIESGRHLHMLIHSVGREVYGVDRREDSIRILREEYGVTRLFVGDVEDLSVPIPKPLDIILAAELIEHLDNPGIFLNSVSRYMSRQTQLVISTPNLLSAKLFAHSLLGRQRIHPDHAAGFTFSLLETLLMRHGYTVLDWMTSVERFGSGRNRIFNPLLLPVFRAFPRYGDTLIAVVKRVEKWRDGDACFEGQLSKAWA